jgi:hypothetical protein
MGEEIMSVIRTLGRTYGRSYLAGASTMAVALAAIFALTGAKAPANHAHFDEITVGRINIIEPDGTKRIVISNKAQFPGAFENGKEIARPDRRSFAGMIFVNEEGTENGGLIQKGSVDKDGKIDSGVSLTFDRYRQDQALQLLHFDNEKRAMTSLRINDVPFHKVTSNDQAMDFVKHAKTLPPAEREAYFNKLSEERRLSENRIYLGTTGDSGSALQLKDARGKTRIMLLVGAKGEAEIRMLDENGKVVKSISPTN